MENDKSPEMIEQEMQETRNSLTDKVASLEDSVMGTLHTATSTVHDTVESVKETVESMKHAMTDTVASVKGTVQESVESVADNVRHAMNFSDHVRNNPWMMLGGAAAVGFVTGLFAFGGRSREHGSDYRPGYGANDDYRYDPPSAPASYAAAAPASAERQAPSEPSWFDRMFDRAGEELRKLGESAYEQASQALQENVHKLVPELIKGAETHLGSVVGGFVGEKLASATRKK